MATNSWLVQHENAHTRVVYRRYKVATRSYIYSMWNMKYKNAKNLTTYSCLTNYAITFKGILVVLTLSRKATKISQYLNLLKTFSNDMPISSIDRLISTDSSSF